MQCTENDSSTQSASSSSSSLKQISSSNDDIIDEHTKELLAKMDEINRNFETDSRSIKSLKVHSRQPSSSSQVSGVSNTDDAQKEKNDSNWRQWSEVLRNWDSCSKRKHFLQGLVRQGIPHEFRPLAWQYLCSAHDSSLKYEYADYLRQPSAYEKHIRRDIARTFPQHEMFKEKGGIGQESLFNVIKAYSLYDREVGYCQGSGFIVGLLLMLLPEEDAFAVVVQMMHGLQLRELYKPKMYELGLRLFQLESLIQEHVSVQLSAHMRAQAFHASLYASSWFLTLFTTTFSTDIAFRVMDLVLSEGLEIVFRIALAYLQLVGDDLLNLDMEAMLNYMHHKAPQRIEEEPNVLFHQASTIKINQKLMKRLEREYSVMKSSELEIEIELRRLRTENGILLQRLDRLESDNNNLTEKLVEVQMQRATEDAENSELKKQLSLLKNQRCKEAGIQPDTTQSSPSPNASARDTSNNSQSSWTSNSDCGTSIPHPVLEAVDSGQAFNLQTEYERVVAALADYQARCNALQEENERLSRHPPNDVATLQEELIASKLREAEANLNMREVRKRLNDLEKDYQQNNAPVSPPTSTKPSLLSSALKSFNNSSSQQQQQMADELSRLKLRNASQHAELVEVRTTIMELQTQNQLYSRQLKRQDEEVQKLRDQLDSARGKVMVLQTTLKETQHRITDMEAKHKEELHLVRLHETEMKSKLAEYQMQSAHLAIQQHTSQAKYSPHFENTESVETPSASDLKPQMTTSDRQLSSLPGIRSVWKNLPLSLMTDSIGPLEELCMIPDDPMITSIYIDECPNDLTSGHSHQLSEDTFDSVGQHLSTSHSNAFCYSNTDEGDESNSTPIMSENEDY